MSPALMRSPPNILVHFGVLLLVSVFGQALLGGRYFDRIVVITFENQNYEAVVADPNFSKYFPQGLHLTNFKAITHPSQPNYWAQVAGSIFTEVTPPTDINVDLDATHVADLMEKRSVTWKMYQEDYPDIEGTCFVGASHLKYRRKHNPLISFANVRNNHTRCMNGIVSGTRFFEDLDSGSLPNFSYYTPDMDNDGHDTDVAFAGRFFDSWASQVLPKLPPLTLVVVTWDESNPNDHSSTNDNQISTLLLGDIVPMNEVDATALTHYSLLRTMLDNWDLGSLGRGDVDALRFNLQQLPTFEPNPEPQASPSPDSPVGPVSLEPSSPPSSQPTLQPEPSANSSTPPAPSHSPSSSSLPPSPSRSPPPFPSHTSENQTSSPSSEPAKEDKKPSTTSLLLIGIIALVVLVALAIGFGLLYRLYSGYGKTKQYTFQADVELYDERNNLGVTSNYEDELMIDLSSDDEFD